MSSPAGPDLPPDNRVTIRHPGESGFLRRDENLGRNIVWWLFACVGLFRRGGFSEVSITRNGHSVHRLIVTPKWYRFPDMAAADLQIGDLWTAPAARGQGLARAAIAIVHDRLGDRFERIWYIVAADNAASIRLIEHCGYRLVGKGVRTRPFGLGALGRFRITDRLDAASPRS
ncbi:MAG: hypothetical protein JWN66_1028 [Sphingomonas bacterium]|nr:hypothetical protein [Sphingomonas bacterium]